MEKEKYYVHRGYIDCDRDDYIVEDIKEFNTLEKSEKYYNSRKNVLYECEYLEIVFENEVLMYCDWIGE